MPKRSKRNRQKRDSKLVERDSHSGVVYPSEYFFNRELNWLEFNKRVLEQAADASLPPLERLKFIAISATNLDEFFMKRIGGLKRQAIAGVKTPSKDGLTATQQLEGIYKAVHNMTVQQHKILINEILPVLASKGVELVEYAALSKEEKKQVDEYFFNSVFPVLTPLGVGPGHPFPFLSNLSLSLAVCLILPGETEPHFARIKVPANRPRFVEVQPGAKFVPLDQVIAAKVDSLFPGAEVLECHPFFVTRNADVERYEEEAEDLVELIHEELRDRKFARLVRLSVNADTSDAMKRYLQEQLGLELSDIYVVPWLLRLSDLFQLASLDHPELKDSEWMPQPHPRVRFREGDTGQGDIFDQLRTGDLLVHHPYQSFDSSVLRLLQEAAEDPHVVTIKQTLYRTAKDSPIVKSLIRAAENGKQVAVLVEIKARFDEANNLRWVQELEAAGVHVAYGLVGLKTHTKVMTVARDEEDGIRLYCHFGTGNYHTGTARLYTDVGYFVSDNRFAGDITQLFNMLTGYNANPEFSKLLIAPVNMRQRFVEMIRREAKIASKGGEGRIIAKMNQLEDDEIIHELYQASQAGVRIELIIRGFCLLRPGVKGMSENIRVRSIIGRFLEHSRIFVFQNKGDKEYYIGSADWMRRNLDHRVELVVPVEDAAAREELDTILASCLKDNTNAWELQKDGSYVRSTPGDDAPFTHQEDMMKRELSRMASFTQETESIRFRPVSHISGRKPRPSHRM